MDTDVDVLRNMLARAQIEVEEVTLDYPDRPQGTILRVEAGPNEFELWFGSHGQLESVETG